MRAEEAEHGVRVTSVYPGRTATAMQEKVHAHEGKDYDPEAWIRPETVADAILGVLDLGEDATVPDAVAQAARTDRFEEEDPQPTRAADPLPVVEVAAIERARGLEDPGRVGVAGRPGDDLAGDAAVGDARAGVRLEVDHPGGGVLLAEVAPDQPQRAVDRGRDQVAGTPLAGLAAGGGEIEDGQPREEAGGAVPARREIRPTRSSRWRNEREKIQAPGLLPANQRIARCSGLPVPWW